MIDPMNFTIAHWIFLKSVAFCYFITYSSLFMQINGLYSSKGILPIADIVSSNRNRPKKELLLNAPSLFWIKVSDSILRYAAAGGIVISLLLLLGAPLSPLLFFYLWVVYLSFLTLGSDFLSFQWDILILEIGFICIFLSFCSYPPLLLLIALWLLLFRLIFSSGAVKLLSRCPAWSSLTAMDYHYETQPIPNRVAWYAHQHPKWLSKLSTLSTFFLELILPFAIFTPNPIRLFTFFLLSFLQLIIFTTGNFAFFNILSLAMGIPLLSNEYLYWLGISLGHPESLPVVALWLLNGFGAFLISLNLLQLSSLFLPLGPLLPVLRFFSPWRIVNGYGLFARMTTVRNEIIVQGSMDGKEWKDYEFKWKPGDTKRAPSQIAPHQPRLDWQMWFAALGNYQQNRWFVRFMGRLLEGNTAVTDLLQTNPFPDSPPKFVRSQLYNYHFSDFKTKKETGQWWTRTPKGEYSPTFSIKEK